MAKRDEEPKALVRHEAPAFIVAAMDGDTSLVKMENQRLIPRALMVQALSSDELKAQFGEGSLVIASASAVLAEKEQSFHVVPLFYFDEYITWRDRRDKTGQPIIARTFDDNHEIAILSETPAKRVELYDGGPPENPWKMHHAHHRNFACMVYGDHQLGGTSVVLSFAKGEAMSGVNWINACLTRKIAGQSAPLWSQVWKLSVVKKTNKHGNKWWGLVASAPDGSLWITEEEGPAFQQLHLDLKKDYEKQLLVVDHGEGEAEAEAEVAGEDGPF